MGVCCMWTQWDSLLCTLFLYGLFKTKYTYIHVCVNMCMWMYICIYVVCVLSVIRTVHVLCSTPCFHWFCVHIHMYACNNEFLLYMHKATAITLLGYCRSSADISGVTLNDRQTNKSAPHLASSACNVPAMFLMQNQQNHPEMFSWSAFCFIFTLLTAQVHR